MDQVVATCRFLGQDPELKSPYIDYAINNLGVRRKPKLEAGSDQSTIDTEKPSHLNTPTGVFSQS